MWWINSALIRSALVWSQTNGSLKASVLALLRPIDNKSWHDTCLHPRQPLHAPYIYVRFYMWQLPWQPTWPLGVCGQLYKKHKNKPISSFVLFYGNIQFLQPLWRRITARLCSLECSPNRCLFPLDLVASSEWFFKSSKPHVAMTFTNAPFPCCVFSMLFKVQWTKNIIEGRKWEESSSLYLFFVFCTINYFPIWIRYETHLGVFQKKSNLRKENIVPSK
jgi:hypothetical protein